MIKCERIKGNILFMDAKLNIVKMSVLPQIINFKIAQSKFQGGFFEDRQDDSKIHMEV